MPCLGSLQFRGKGADVQFPPPEILIWPPKEHKKVFRNQHKPFSVCEVSEAFKDRRPPGVWRQMSRSFTIFFSFFAKILFFVLWPFWFSGVFLSFDIDQNLGKLLFFSWGGMRHWKGFGWWTQGSEGAEQHFKAPQDWRGAVNMTVLMKKTLFCDWIKH